MVQFDKFTLDNGLRVLVHSDHSTPLMAMNILYGVGARDENPDRTGFAHLFEHLMFGGSKNIPEYDKPLELAGGDNNAFTNNDITNYYLTIPSMNMELAFWLESDRMLDLAFTPQSLEVQRKVVIEEFKQRYLNQPYGDAWLHLRPMVYKVHPYQWATIGKEISHIENATMEDVKAFYSKWYNPGNAVMVLSGNITLEKAREMCDKWFAPIQKKHEAVRNLPKEPKQTEFREVVLERNVPFRSFYRAYHMVNRLHLDYPIYDLISDLLSNGASSRLYQRLSKDQELFSNINAYISGDVDDGTFIIHGELNDGRSFSEVFDALDVELQEIIDGKIGAAEMEKVKNKYESTFEFSKTSVLNKAMNLAYYEWLGDASMMNNELAKYKMVSIEDVKRVAASLFCRENLSELKYEPSQNHES
jgi:predicted Zn-dependent peptidase